MDHAAAQAWLDAYVAASWLGDSSSGTASTRDDPGTYSAAYMPVAVEGDVVVATDSSTYRRKPGGPVRQVFDNCFVIRFDERGQCREFTEYFVKRA